MDAPGKCLLYDDSMTRVYLPDAKLKDCSALRRYYLI